MKEPLPPRWSRRIRLIYVMVTAFGSVVLIVFLLLMWLLYWMKAPFEIPNPERLIHPQATACIVIDVKPASKARELPGGFSNALASGAPEQAGNLIWKGLSDAKCPVQVVASVASAGEGFEETLAVSLGRYPGLFRVVRKDLKRRCESGLLNASVSHYEENEVFIGQKDEGRLNVLSLIACTMIRGSNQSVTETLLDRFNKGESALAAGPMPSAVFGKRVVETAKPIVSGWVGKWQYIPVDFFLVDPLKADLEVFASGLESDVPGITRIRDVQFHGQMGAGLISFDISFEPSPEDNPEALGRLIQSWVGDNGKSLSVKVGDVAVHDGRVELSLDVRSKGE